MEFNWPLGRRAVCDLLLSYILELGGAAGTGRVLGYVRAQVPLQPRARNRWGKRQVTPKKGRGVPKGALYYDYISLKDKREEKPEW